ncbi:MAG: copper resistance protein NlpE N-terminal domain-containing protein [Candidatus Omnitrophica bacterium]|nr:copper resistance protein NlpE N-terminal domain-containing protein [Candidatus Omnitrophota bacterium]
MRKVIFIASILVMMSGCSYFKKAPAAFDPWYPSANENGDPVFAVFEGRIPCMGQMAIPDCNKIKVGLALYQNAQTQLPTTYLLARVGVGTGNDRITNAGNLTLTHGTVLDPQAVVYQLDTNAPQEFRSYWVIGRDILFMLDQDRNPRVGDAAYSYVLNRMKPAKSQL